MRTKEMNKMLRDNARELGLCDKWYNDWDTDSTKVELIEKYKRGIDFCIRNDFPKLEQIKELVSEGLLNRHGIFVGGDASLVNEPFVVLLGDSDGKITVQETNTSSIYMRHNSSADVEVLDGGRAFIEVYENAVISVYADAHSKAYVYQHGGIVNAHGNVLVRERRSGTV